MNIIVIIFLFLLLILVCNKLSNFFFKTADYIDERKRKENYLKDRLLEAVSDIRDSIVPEKELENNVGRLLDANKELRERDKITAAIEEELGIEMHTPRKKI